jgi:hypothetical protein
MDLHLEEGEKEGQASRLRERRTARRCRSFMILQKKNLQGAVCWHSMAEKRCKTAHRGSDRDGIGSSRRFNRGPTLGLVAGSSLSIRTRR